MHQENQDNEDNGKEMNSRKDHSSESSSPSSPSSSPSRHNARHCLPRNNKEYGTREYWEDRFTTEESFDWLLSFEQLEPQLRRSIRPFLLRSLKQLDDGGVGCCRILVVGCGNAPFSAHLYRACCRWVLDEDQYHLLYQDPSSLIRIVNIDYSSTVIDKMKQKYPTQEYPGMTWHVADMTKPQELVSI